MKKPAIEHCRFFFVCPIKFNSFMAIISTIFSSSYKKAHMNESISSKPLYHFFRYIPDIQFVMMAEGPLPKL